METADAAESNSQKYGATPDLAKLIDLVKMLSDVSGDAAIPAHSPPPANTLAFDELSSTPRLKLIKASIPYLEPEHQKTIGIAIKIAEIRNLMQSFETQTIEPTVQTASTASNRNNMLAAVRPYLDADKQYLVDMFIKLDEVQSILGFMQTANH